MKNNLAWSGAAMVLLSATCLHAGQSAAGVIKYGLALVPGCVIFDGAAVAVGTQLTVISADSKKRFAMTVGEPMEHCGGDRNGDPGYELVGKVDDDTGFDGLFVAAIGSAAPDLKVHQCTSNEGAHVFLTHGQHASPFWHQYYYAGYDTEPTCTKRDIQWIEKLNPSLRGR